MTHDITLYAITVPPLRRTLGNLKAILGKARDHAEARSIDPAVLVNARLYPDMFPLSRQVQIATDIAKGGACRLAGLEVPRYEDDETGFAELIERLERTLALLDTLTPGQFEGAEDRDIVLPMRDTTLQFKGLPYLLDFVMPNVYFHVSTAYAILRHNGVEIGKKDFLGNLQ